ncbi:MAG TPA: GNAT family N-acetyltransferase [Thermoanaerobaculia bacterium]|nr:GNAT family N-acetyltransferase [Thermoanaerobaculia bacterium]
MTEHSAWIIRPYREGDQAAILRLCLKVFGAEMPAAHWRWQMLGNPTRQAVIWVAETRGGTMTGHCSLIPVPLWRDGKVGIGAWSILSMVHPDYQRQGILRKLVAAAEAQFAEANGSAGFAFVNQNSIHVYTRQMGWSELQSEMPVYFAVLDPSQVLRKYISSTAIAGVAGTIIRPFTSLLFRSERGSQGADLRISRVDEFDERVDEIWESVRPDVKLATDRSWRYLRWRFTESPREYVLHIAEDRGQLSGIVVTRVDMKFGQRFGYIAEFFFRPGADEAGVALLARARGVLREAGCGMVTAMALEPPAIRNALERAGFRRLPRRLMPHPIHFISKDLTPRKDSLTDPSSWFVSWSDHDVV